jgi:hypothetical protein
MLIASRDADLMTQGDYCAGVLARARDASSSICFQSRIIKLATYFHDIDILSRL